MQVRQSLNGIGEGLVVDLRVIGSDESRTKEAVDEQSGPGGSGALEVERRRPLAAIVGKPSYNPAS
jgi:hypothetical protein